MLSYRLSIRHGLKSACRVALYRFLTLVHGRMLGPTWKPVLRPSSWLRMKDLPCRARPLTATTATANRACGGGHE